MLVLEVKDECSDDAGLQINICKFQTSFSISKDQIYLCEDGEAEEGLGGEGVGHLAEAEQADEDNQTELHRAASSKSSQIEKALS